MSKVIRHGSVLEVQGSAAHETILVDMSRIAAIVTSPDGHLLFDMGSTDVAISFSDEEMKRVYPKVRKHYVAYRNGSLTALEGATAFDEKAAE